MKKVAIVYTSLSGNTRDTAKLICEFLNQFNIKCQLFKAESCPPLLNYELVIFGSYTWGDGDLPTQMTEILHSKLGNISRAALFGTGDTAYYYYCGAVNKMAQILTAKGIKIDPYFLKIEQSPFGLNQQKSISRWTASIVKNMEEQYVTKNTSLFTEESKSGNGYY